jgi:hypothetical protein
VADAAFKDRIQNTLSEIAAEGLEKPERVIVSRQGAVAPGSRAVVESSSRYRSFSNVAYADRGQGPLMADFVEKGRLKR